jgi:hypothetical protein
MATIKGGTLRGRAIWHEDIHDPGDGSEIDLTFKLVGDSLEFYLGDEEISSKDSIVLRRVRDKPEKSFSRLSSLSE